MDTFAAENTFIAVEYNQRVAVVDGIIKGDIIETPVLEFEMLTGCDVLQFAFFIFYASCAVQCMVAQQQVKGCLTHSFNDRAVKCNRHPVKYLLGARCDGTAGVACYLHKA